MPFVYLSQHAGTSNFSIGFGIQGISEPYSLCFRARPFLHVHYDTMLKKFSYFVPYKEELN